MPDSTTNEQILARALERLEAKDTNQQLQILNDRISQIAQDTAIHGERDHAIATAFRELKEDFKEVKKELATVKDEVSEIRAMANKWRGGFMVLMGLGGAAGSIVGFWDKIAKLFH